MAVRYAVASGNWSNVATWDGGTTVPTAGDDVYANNFAVTIDQDITVISINTTASSPAVAGGSFTSAGNNRNITANIIGGTSICLTATQTGTLTIIGNINGGTLATGVGLVLSSIGTVNITGNITAGTQNNTDGIRINAGGLVNLTGNINGGSGFQAYGINLSAINSRLSVTGIITGGVGAVGIYNNSATVNNVTINGTCISNTNPAVQNQSTGSITINGNQTAVGSSGVYAILNNSTGIININGDCLGALSSAPSTAYILNNNSSGTVNISGSVTARSVSPSSTIGIVNNASTGTINITQNVSGGTVANTIGISNAGTGTVNVTGNITGGSNATNTPAIYSTTAGTIDVTGTATAGLYPALYSTSTTATNILRGNITNALGVPAYFTYKVTISPTAVQTVTMQDTSNVSRLFSTSNVSVGAPPVTDVRSGIVYGSNNELTGTMIVPTPANVRNGVLTDNTVGTADLTISEFWDISAANLNVYGSIGDRVRNAATVESTGDQLAAF